MVIMDDWTLMGPLTRFPLGRVWLTNKHCVFCTKCCLMCIIFYKVLSSSLIVTLLGVCNMCWVLSLISHLKIKFCLIIWRFRFVTFIQHLICMNFNQQEFPTKASFTITDHCICVALSCSALISVSAPFILTSKWLISVLNAAALQWRMTVP